MSWADWPLQIVHSCTLQNRTAGQKEHTGQPTTTVVLHLPSWTNPRRAPMDYFRGPSQHVLHFTLVHRWPPKMCRHLGGQETLTCPNHNGQGCRGFLPTLNFTAQNTEDLIALQCIAIDQHSLGTGLGKSLNQHNIPLRLAGVSYLITPASNYPSTSIYLGQKY